MFQIHRVRLYARRELKEIIVQSLKLIDLNCLLRRSRHSSDGQRSIRERSSDRHSSDSSESSSEEDDESNDSNKGSNVESNDGSDYNNPSPLSVDRLAKSDHSDGESPGHVDSNGATKNMEEEEKKEEVPELPPYLPAIQGETLRYFVVSPSISNVFQSR